MAFIRFKHNTTDGRVTLDNDPNLSEEELRAIGQRVADKILTIREHDNMSLLPLVGRQVYLSDYELTGLKSLGLLSMNGLSLRIYGYDIITDKDLK